MELYLGKLIFVYKERLIICVLDGDLDVHILAMFKYDYSVTISQVNRIPS